MCLDDACTRREFLAGAAAAGAGLLAGESFLAAALRDPGVVHGPAAFASSADGATIRAHVGRPARAGRHPVVLVNHGDPGIPEGVRAATAWLATLGFAAI